MIGTTKRLGALILVGAFAFAACSSSGATTAPSAAASQAASSAPSAAASDNGSPAPSMAAAPVPPTAAVTLQGAGATFPTPLYDSWFQTYTGLYSNIQFDYQSIGSGGGIKAITQQTVDFGASDAAMKDEEIAALPAGT